MVNLDCVFLKIDKTDSIILYVKVPDDFFGEEFYFKIIDNKICLINTNTKKIYKSDILNHETMRYINNKKTKFIFVNEELTQVFEAPSTT